jgi:hypothetical protein
VIEMRFLQRSISWLIRTILQVCIRKPDFNSLSYPPEIYICTPEKIKNDSELLSEIIFAYQDIFFESWNEKWDYEIVKQKVLTEPSIIVIWKDEKIVKGFSWGNVLNKNQLIDTLRNTLGLNTKVIKNINDENVLYIHELGIRKEYRGGIDPLRWFLVPLFQKGLDEGVKKVIFWTAPFSPVSTLAFLTGCTIIDSVYKDGKKILIMMHPNLESLLKLSLSSTRKIRKFLNIAKKLKKFIKT